MKRDRTTLSLFTRFVPFKVPVEYRRGIIIGYITDDSGELHRPDAEAVCMAVNIWKDQEKGGGWSMDRRNEFIEHILSRYGASAIELRGSKVIDDKDPTFHWAGYLLVIRDNVKRVGVDTLTETEDNLVVDIAEGRFRGNSVVIDRDPYGLSEPDVAPNFGPYIDPEAKTNAEIVRSWMYNTRTMAEVSDETETGTG